MNKTENASACCCYAFLDSSSAFLSGSVFWVVSRALLCICLGFLSGFTMHLLGYFECCYVVASFLSVFLGYFCQSLVYCYVVARVFCVACLLFLCICCSVLSGFFSAFHAVGLLGYSEWV